MQIEKIKVSDIKGYEYNAKLHPQSQVEQIKQSIADFGFNDPIAIDENNVIIEGHGRFKAIQQMGWTEVECIRLPHMDEQQKKAYILAHNKLTMNTDFDPDMLAMELEGIIDFDMEDYGFEIPEIFDEPEDEPDYKVKTQELKENILNLAYAQFPGAGAYDTPQIEPVYTMPEVSEWIGFNYVLSDKKPEGKGVHFFVDDYQFERVWNNPDAYIEKLSRYACVMAPDFSPYGDMPLATQIFNHYRKHWVAAYWQAHGITVIPTIRCSTDERSLDWYLDGEPEFGVVAYSSMWVREDREEVYKCAEKEFKTMVEKLHPEKVLVYGNIFPFMEGVEVEKIEKFTEKRWANA